MAPLQETIEEYNELQQSSPIQQFYKNKNIFITGATGFLGKVLIEKLLRACDVERIFILIRSKKNDDINTRMEKIFEDQLFDQVRKNNPTYRQKIYPINGDCILPGLGISLSDRALLIKHCNIVFHGAATVRFDEKLKLALAINVCGTREIMNLAKEMENLQAFLHISTAYANCPHPEIEEKFYSTPISGENGTYLAEMLDEETLEKMTPALLRDWPNTYTYTKSLAEDYVRAHSKNLPVAVFRPAIVIPTFREPLRGWIDNMYGPTGIVIGVAAGLLRVLHINKENRAELVPVDMSVNSLIACAYDVGINNHYDEPPIYNYVTSKKNSISWQDYCDYSILNGVTAPLSKMAWYFTFTMVSSKNLAILLTFLYHTLPAAIIDGVLVLCGKTPKLLDTYRKIHKLCNVLSYFTNRVWSFKNHNVENLWRKLDIKDKELFFFDMNDIEWPMFFVESIYGIRTYLMKEDPKTIPEACKRLKKMRIIHYVTVYVIRFGVLYFLYKILKSILF
ncbi:hypothetical protein PVAND_003716 [Polypedilum vanderplanki]|uniref:Fatty acyl-CoA reductase n=1 Tax=Polypedilum vanderplanki TaxID=319348 RepID=A0A9J6BW01_POLVA|nr:hypothetical protein PVAND_003716 [Polypedilum vanderplanki]